MKVFEDAFGVVHLAGAQDTDTHCRQPFIRATRAEVPTCLACIGVQLAREQFPMFIARLKERFPDLLGRK